MRSKKINIKQIKNSNTLSIPYHMDIVPIRRKYEKFLNKKFSDNVKVPFKKLVEKVNNDESQIGDIIIFNYIEAKLKIEVIQKNKKTKKFIHNVFRVIDDRVSAQYILWIFSQNEVKEYIKIHAVGSLLRHIPLQVIENLMIPIPRLLDKNSSKNRITISTNHNPVREVIKNFYLDYQENFNSNRYNTAIILAGAICEAILYESLIEVGIPEKILSQNKTLGTLIEYAHIKELDKHYKINLTHFESIKQERNKAIHIGLAVKKLKEGEIISQYAFKDFDQIIKNFGI
jgi:hypothetical protein